MLRKWMFAILASAALSTLPFICCSCEGKGDSGDAGGEKAITGDSTLEVINRSSDETTLYFDGDYIGNVRGDATRSWSVPSGEHRIETDNAEKDNSDGIDRSFSFSPGRVTSIWVDWDD